MTKKFYLFLFVLGLGSNLFAQRFQLPKQIFVSWAFQYCYNVPEDGEILGESGDGTIDHYSLSNLSIALPLQKNFMVALQSNLGIPGMMYAYREITDEDQSFNTSVFYHGVKKGLDFSFQLQYFPFGVNSRIISPYLYAGIGRVHFKSTLELDDKNNYVDLNDLPAELEYNHVSMSSNIVIGFNLRIRNGTFLHFAGEYKQLSNPLILETENTDDIRINKGVGINLGIVQRIKI